MSTRKPSFTVTRRDLLKGALVITAPLALGLGGCAESDEPASDIFKHGVASGNPLPDGIMLWTRVNGSGKVDVAWDVAEDATMQMLVMSGSFRTDADRDFTVKVDVRGLQPGHTYFYRFRALGETSRIGRTRTAPSGVTNHLRFAVVACASYAHGYFHGYRALATQGDLDAVLHLGDYIYEYAAGNYGDVRQYEPPNEILTLTDYRLRHSQYKLDADLQEVHRQHPFITIWDDHETANDSYKDGAENHTPDTEGSWEDRKAAGKRAYMEWMPIREQVDGRIFREVAFGDLVDLVLLDTRLWARTKQPGGFVGPLPAPDPARTLLGDDQAAWMEDRLKTSKARWRLLGQQVMVGNLILEPGKSIANLDQWHGYPESRARLLAFFRDSGVKDTVVLTGDIHSSWANELVGDPNDPAQYDPKTGKGAVAVEFVTPGITSPGIPEAFVGLVDSARPVNPHIRWVDPTRRGFMILDVTRERVQAAWFHFDDITMPASANLSFANAWSVRAGETRLVSDAAAAPATEGAPPLAP